MQRYETLLLARTEATEDDLGMVEKYFDQLLSDSQGTLDSFDRWGKYRLAYPVKKDTHGVYILVRYQIPESRISKMLVEIDRFMKIKCSNFIMRYVNIRLDPNASSTYIKPEPMDITRPGGSLDTLLKDNKIESLLSSVDGRHSMHNDDDNNDSDLA